MEGPTRRLTLERLLVIAAAVGLTVVFFSRFQPASLLVKETVGPTAAAACVLLASLAAGFAGLRGGRAAVQWLDRQGPDRSQSFDSRGDAQPASESPPLSLLDCLIVGVPFLGTIVGAVAWIGVLMSPIIIGLTLLGAGGGVWLLLRGTAWSRGGRWRPRAILILPIAIGLIEAITPVNSPDELVYKLAVPRAYQLYGRMVELPLSSNSYYAAALRTADLAALLLSSGVAAKLVHFGMYLAALAVIARFGDRLRPGSGIWAAAVFAWTPALMLIAGWAWDEWDPLESTCRHASLSIL